MDHYSFQGPYAYRWVNDVPVERIRLSNGERRLIHIGERHRFVPPAATTPTGLRALMAAWN